MFGNVQLVYRITINTIVKTENISDLAVGCVLIEDCVDRECKILIVNYDCHFVAVAS